MNYGCKANLISENCSDFSELKTINCSECKQLLEIPEVAEQPVENPGSRCQSKKPYCAAFCARISECGLINYEPIIIMSVREFAVINFIVLFFFYFFFQVVHSSRTILRYSAQRIRYTRNVAKFNLLSKKT